MAKARIGISGWRYAPWRKGKFYPKDLPQREELAYASRSFSTIELNGSFYSLQRPESYQQWRNATPRQFVFAVKAPRYVTHVKRLHDIKGPLANFFASGVLELREKLGPMLWQFPPNFRYDADLFEAFLEQLPRDTHHAALLARHHDRVVSHVATGDSANRRLRHAVEIRHESFAVPEFIAQLRRHGVAIVLADTAGKWPFIEDITASFLYLRLHGDKKLYTSGYDDATLAWWRQRIKTWMRGAQPHKDTSRVSSSVPPKRQGRDVYCYFDNDVKVRAPRDAAKLDSMVNG